MWVQHAGSPDWYNVGRVVFYSTHVCFGIGLSALGLAWRARHNKLIFLFFIAPLTGKESK